MIDIDVLAEHLKDNDYKLDDYIEINSRIYQVENVYHDISGYDDGIATYITVYKIDDRYFKVVNNYNSWDSGYYSVVEVKITGYKQIPIFEDNGIEIEI